MTPSELTISHCPSPNFKIDGVYCRFIPLTQGQITIVWAADYEWLSQWKWYAHWSKFTNSFYAVRSYQGTTIYMARALLELVDADIHGDHRNRITLDNRRNNLRESRNGENARNCKLSICNTSGRKGVNWHKRQQKWIAYISVDKVQIHLGSYDSFEFACDVRATAEQKYHGEFARSK